MMRIGLNKRSVILVFLMIACLAAVQVMIAQAQTPSLPTQTVPVSTDGTSGPTSETTNTVLLSTPVADGKIIHIVQPGETLITIAEAYAVAVSVLLELNGLTADAVIFPGDELTIQAGFTPTPSSPPTMTPTQTSVPTSTRRPTRTPSSLTPAATEELQTTLMPAADTAQPKSDSIGTVLLVAIALLGGGGILMIIVGGLLRRSA